VIVGYDGSASAACAIDEAARLFPGADAVIATVWRTMEPPSPAALLAMPESVVAGGVENLDAATAQAAGVTAEEGALRGHDAGLVVTPVAVRAERAVWTALARLADEREASAVVVGSRGRSGLCSALLGSVSQALVHHCRRPVVVVHPPDEPVAERT
jgi:nucleotide-binding universal stress UspA family protein